MTNSLSFSTEYKLLTIFKVLYRNIIHYQSVTELVSAYGEERKINSDVKDKHAHNKASAQIINHLGFNVTIRLDDNLRLVNEDDGDGKKFLICS